MDQQTFQKLSSIYLNPSRYIKLVKNQLFDQKGRKLVEDLHELVIQMVEKLGFWARFSTGWTSGM